jgi:tetratricopeptide (TPR) repeat protein
MNRRLTELTGRSVSMRTEGLSLYENSQLVGAARLHDRAAGVAEAAGRSREAGEARFWQGVALHGAGRLREALAALATFAAGAHPGDVDQRTRYMALTRYILIAVDTPLTLASIEHAIEDAERRENMAGTGRRARLLLVRSRLANLRGRHGEALELTYEGLARARQEDGAFALGTYYKEAVRACIRLGRFDEFQRLLDSWKQVRDVYTASRHVFIMAFHSCLCRRTGRIDEAIEAARVAHQAATCSDELYERFIACEQLARALQLSSQAPNARDTLLRLLPCRRAEPTITRYEWTLLSGDHHLSLAEFHGDLPATDPESGSTAERPGQPNRSLAHLHLRRAGRAYRSALYIGTTIDHRLDCTVRAAEVRDRERGLQRVARQLAPGEYFRT